MKPTRVGTLVALLVAVAAVAWGFLQISVNQGMTLPPLAWTAPAGIAALTVVVFVTALALRSRLDEPEKRPHPLSMARMAVLGKASAHVGPLVGGLYAGYLVLLLPGLDIGSRRDRAVLCLVALLASVALSAAGLLLERSCRVPPAESDDNLPAARA
jgi:MFS family permease